MTTFAFPSVVPTSQSWGLRSNTSVYISPYTGATQTIDRGGERWEVTLNFTNLNGAKRAEMQAFITRLNGQQHRFTLQRHANPARGAFGGTPLVSGASQTGTTLNIDGASPSVTNWIRAGDFFGVDGKLKMCVADANSDVSGNVAIELMPRIQTAPADNSAIITSGATGTFILSENTVSWTDTQGGFSTLNFNAFEDIVA